MWDIVLGMDIPLVKIPEITRNFLYENKKLF